MIAVIVISIIVLLGILYYLFPLIQVVGDSMFPTYYDQEIVIGNRLYPKSKLKSGDVVVYKSPEDEYRVVIKRIDKIRTDRNGNRMFYCLGDNSECSHDSRHYGFVHSKNLVCKVIITKRRIFIESLCKGGNDNDE